MLPIAWLHHNDLELRYLVLVNRFSGKSVILIRFVKYECLIDAADPFQHHMSQTYVSCHIA